MKIIETIKSYIWAFYIIIFKKYKGHSYLSPVDPEPGDMIFYSEEDGKFIDFQILTDRLIIGGMIHGNI